MILVFLGIGSALLACRWVSQILDPESDDHAGPIFEGSVAFIKLGLLVIFWIGILIGTLV